MHEDTPNIKEQQLDTPGTTHDLCIAFQSSSACSGHWPLSIMLIKVL